MLDKLGMSIECTGAWCGRCDEVVLGTDGVAPVEVAISGPDNLVVVVGQAFRWCTVVSTMLYLLLLLGRRGSVVAHRRKMAILSCTSAFAFVLIAKVEAAKLFGQSQRGRRDVAFIFDAFSAVAVGAAPSSFSSFRLLLRGAWSPFAQVRWRVSHSVSQNLDSSLAKRQSFPSQFDSFL